MKDNDEEKQHGPVTDKRKGNGVREEGKRNQSVLRRKKFVAHTIHHRQRAADRKDHPQPKETDDHENDSTRAGRKMDGTEPGKASHKV
jgi:hypothetical protein